MDIHRVAVVGAGSMGASIATVVSQAGIPVLLKDVNPDAAAQGMAQVRRILQSRVEKSAMTPEGMQQCVGRITPVDNYDWFDQVDLVIEAMTEDIDIKLQVFRDLDAATRPEIILASHTSFQSITRLAAVTDRSSQVIGLHFFHPAHVMKLVEVVAGLGTDEEVVEAATEFCKELGKFPVQIEECPSFLVNRLLDRYLNEALYVLMDRLATPEEIDQAAVDLVMPMGPVTLFDFTGLDVLYNVSQFNYEEYGPRFKPAPLLIRMHERGWFGQHTGLGFYQYDFTGRNAIGINPELAKMLESYPGRAGSFEVNRLFLPMINEAFFVLQEDVVDPIQLDPAMRAGLGMRKGPLQLAEEIGLRECLEQIEWYFRRLGERFRPAPLLKRLVWGQRTYVIR